MVTIPISSGFFLVQALLKSKDRASGVVASLDDLWVQIVPDWSIFFSVYDGQRREYNLILYVSQKELFGTVGCGRTMAEEVPTEDQLQLRPALSAQEFYTLREATEANLPQFSWRPYCFMKDLVASDRSTDGLNMKVMELKAKTLLYVQYP